MPRMLWLGLGFLAGMAAASRQVHETRLDLVPAREHSHKPPKKKDSRDFKQKIADRLEGQSGRIGELIGGRGHQWVDTLSEQVDSKGRMLASRLRGQGQPPQRDMASSAYGAGTASLSGTETPLGSKAYPAGTASLPMDQQAIRNPDTVK